MSSPPFTPTFDPVVIALDGPAAAGKGTVARALAAEMGFHYLDTGSLYRTVALAVLNDNGDPKNSETAEKAARTLQFEGIQDAALRTERVSQAASLVAAIPGVRQAILDFQRQFSRKLPGAVLDGRDIGTVVCPDADVKIFVTASAEIRANRRFLELEAKGETVTEAAVLEEVQARDARDETRENSPTRRADDAHLLDTSNLSIEAAVRAAIDIVRGQLSTVAGSY